MSVLYIAGSNSGAGKTAFSTGLAQILSSNGHSVAIVKPIKLVTTKEQPSDDQDSNFFVKHFGNAESNGIHPLLVSEESIQNKVLPEEVAKIIAPIELSNEFVLIEGLDGISLNDTTSEVSAAIAAQLNARVIIVAEYHPSVSEHALTDASQLFGPSLLGIILNKVWRNRNHLVANHVVPAIEKEGSRVLGVIPEDRRMLAPSVSDVATHLSGTFLENNSKTEQPVDYIMTGGWYLDQGAYVLSRRNYKAVVVRGDRPDLQMAALTTSTSCLILTEGQHPIQYITYHAEQEEIPILLTQDSTLTTMDRLNTLGNHVTVHNDWKISRFVELIESHCSLSSILP